MNLMKQNRLDDFLLFNFLAKDKENAKEIIEAGAGFVVPGIVSSDFEEIEDAVAKVNELKEVSPIISIGLGNGGDTSNWKKVLQIAEQSTPGHLNQPFEKTTYSTGYLHGKGIDQVVNGLVTPTGKVGYVKLSTGIELSVEELVNLAVALGVESIKFMPLNGFNHLDELVYLTKVAAKQGIKAIEPAGGISGDNIVEIVKAVEQTGIELFMPHIFGSTIDKETGRTKPDEVKKIVELVRGR
jgi:2-dehydro-3-deoxy-phosphogluconate aldolase